MRWLTVFGLLLWLLSMTLLRAPADAHTAVSALHPLPVGQETAKLLIDQTGIHQLSYAELDAAGLAVASWNPHTLQLLHRGETAAFQFIGDDDEQFEPGEAIRFYAWAFDGSRYERQFVTHNVFWLWANGAETAVVASQPNTPASTGQPFAMHTLTIEPENDFFAGWTDQWSRFPNEPDAWYWDRIPQSGVGANQLTLTYPLTLPMPLINETAVSLTTEWMSRAKSSQPGDVSQTVTIQLNDGPTESVRWNGRQNINLSQTLPASVLRQNNNALTAVVSSDDVIYLNRVTIRYPQLLEFVPHLPISSSQTVQISHLPTDDTLLVWEVSDRQRPLMITVQPNQINNNMLRLGLGDTVTRQYTLTTHNDLHQPLAIERYVPVTLTHEATWVAITHPTLRPAAEKLAAYRQGQGLKTAVFDSTTIINQVGYGLPLPTAFQQFLAQHPPEYALLLGDATLNPRGHSCAFSCVGTGWDADEPTLLPTDLLFVDRFQGLIPTDQTMADLDQDGLPDVMLGRIAAQTLPEAETAVDKTIAYERQSQQPNPQRSILFLADNSDAAGNFCLGNQQLGNQLPVAIPQTQLCLPTDPTSADLANLHTRLFAQLNQDGAYILNYRGHGSVQYWGGGSELLMSVNAENSMIGSWLNSFPTVILSADCLDGHFAWPGLPAISETLLTLPGSGTAAHWSSTGLGTEYEHGVLHSAFYDALFSQPNIRIGQAIANAQLTYAAQKLHPSPLYSFTLQGDPALKFDWVQHSRLFLPLAER